MVNRMKKEIDQLIECQGDILSADAVIMLYKIRNMDLFDLKNKVNDFKNRNLTNVVNNIVCYGNVYNFAQDEVFALKDASSKCGYIKFTNTLNLYAKIAQDISLYLEDHPITEKWNLLEKLDKSLLKQDELIDKIINNKMGQDREIENDEEIRKLYQYRRRLVSLKDYDKNIYTELFPDIVKYIDMGYDITAINTLCSYINAKERVTTGLDTNISTLYSKIYRLLGNNSNKEYKDSYILWDNIKYSYKHNDLVLTKCLNK